MQLFISNFGKDLFLDSKLISSILEYSNIFSFISFSGAIKSIFSVLVIILFSPFGLFSLNKDISLLKYGSKLISSLSISVSASFIFFFLPLIKIFSLLIFSNIFSIWLSTLLLINSSPVSVSVSFFFIFFLFIANSSFVIDKILLNSFLSSISVSFSFVSFFCFLNPNSQFFSINNSFLIISFLFCSKLSLLYLSKVPYIENDSSKEFSLLRNFFLLNTLSCFNIFFVVIWTCFISIWDPFSSTFESVPSKLISFSLDSTNNNLSFLSPVLSIISNCSVSSILKDTFWAFGLFSISSFSPNSSSPFSSFLYFLSSSISFSLSIILSTSKSFLNENSSLASGFNSLSPHFLSSPFIINPSLLIISLFFLWTFLNLVGSFFCRYGSSTYLSFFPFLFTLSERIINSFFSISSKYIFLFLADFISKLFSLDNLVLSSLNLFDSLLGVFITIVSFIFFSMTSGIWLPIVST